MPLPTTTPTPQVFQIGSLRCTVLSDGALSVPASFLFRNAPHTELREELQARELDAEAIPAGLNCLLIESGDVRLLWDTGTGGRWHDGLGRLDSELQGAGIDPESMDVVILSHGHPDHIGGLVRDDGRLRFPRARYAMSRAEWEYWTDEGSLARLDPAWADVARTVLPRIAGRVELAEGSHEVKPGIRIVPSPGHTPGHIALWLESAGDRLLCVGDALGHPITVTRPDWVTGSDGDPAQTRATRRALLELASENDAHVFANHFVFPGTGRVVREDGRYMWREST